MESATSSQLCPFPCEATNCAAGADRRSRGQALDRRIVRQNVRRNQLEVRQTGTIVQFDKGKVFEVAPRPHPPLHENISRGAVLWRASATVI